MIWICWLVAAVICLSVAVAALTTLFMWYEMASGPELENLRRQSQGRAARWVLRSLVTSTTSQLLCMATYPASLCPRLWLPSPSKYPDDPDAPAVLLVHGIFHASSAWVWGSKALARKGLPRCHVWSYRSYFQDFAKVTQKLDRRIRQVLEAEPHRPLALVGHSMGGLLIRAWLNARPDDSGDTGNPRSRICAVVTLGTPHQGSKLACLGSTRLARQLAFSGELIRWMEAGETPPPCPCLALRTPVDNMVLPAEGSRIHAAGWLQEDTSPVGHIQLIYDAKTMDRTADFIVQSARRAASPAPEQSR